MLLYDSKSRFAVLLHFQGTVWARLWRVGLFEILYSAALMVLAGARRPAPGVEATLLPEVLPEMDSPYAARHFGLCLAFAVCFRTNIAWSRYWETLPLCAEPPRGRAAGAPRGGVLEQGRVPCVLEQGPNAARGAALGAQQNPWDAERPTSQGEPPGGAALEE